MFSTRFALQKSAQWAMSRQQTLRAMPIISTPQRFFDLHEYHSKKLMGSFGINVQKGALARSAEEALTVAKSLDNSHGLVVKA